MITLRLIVGTDGHGFPIYADVADRSWADDCRDAAEWWATKYLPDAQVLIVEQTTSVAERREKL